MEAFIKLNEVGTKSFHQDAPYHSWNGFRLLAIDGSNAILTKQKSVTEEFGITNFGPYADSPRSVARTSVLYDVLNLTELDGQIRMPDDWWLEVRRMLEDGGQKKK